MQAQISDSLSTSVFERNSFQLFTSKVAPVFKLEAALAKVLKQLNQALDKKN
jgi:hypothetical protein